MATNFPGSLDSSTQQPTIASSDEMDDSGKEHDVVHTNHSGAIIALETKLGTGDSNAVADAVLMGTGSGTSAWDTSPTFKGAVTVGVDDTGHDVKFFGATSGKYMEWDESADQLNVVGSLNVTGNTQITGTLTVGVDDTGHDVIFYGATSANSFFWWDQSEDALQIAGHTTLGNNTTNYLDFRTGVTGTEGLIRWVFNKTDGTTYATMGITYDDRATHGFYLDSGYPITLDATTDINFEISGTEIAEIDSTGIHLSGSTKFHANNITASAASEWANLNHSYGLYVDNAGPGSANTRMWFNGFDGAALYIGPRSGSHTWNLIRIAASSISLLGTVSKTAGSFDIPHPSRGGDWRLRHSFIEGPTADNIYRGTTTISGDSATIDLDTVSGMTDGTWLALNTNPWTMVASSGNAVTWSLSGKTLTINGPDGAVCSWMVIGERKDQGIVDSPMTDSNGKLVVEYEDAERDACPED